MIEIFLILSPASISSTVILNSKVSVSSNIDPIVFPFTVYEILKFSSSVAYVLLSLIAS